MTRKSPGQARKVSALENGLRGMFRALELRPVPDRLASVVDQLDEDEAAVARKAGRG